MEIRSVELFHVELPLRKTVRHASHERSSSENLVVRVRLGTEVEGFGEGVPRPYVTGETIETTFRALASVDVPSHIGRPRDFAGLVQRLEAFDLPENADDPRGMAANAARCALELAVLDAYGKHFGESVAAAIRLADVAGLHRTTRPVRVRYSGAVTAESAVRERISAWKMWLYGFHQVKLKVGVAGQDDERRLRSVRGIVGRRMDLRLDANEAWHPAELIERVRPLLPFSPSALEQPVPHAEVDSLAGLRPRLGVPVMLDESLCGLPDAVRAIERGTADLLNVRLSKCGGIIPTLRIIGLAQRSGLGVQLGCHPGESGLLSAAGRHVASNVGGLRYVEGSYDRHILAGNLTGEDLTFGYGGRAYPLKGNGLGVHVDPEMLARMTKARKEIRYD